MAIGMEIGKAIGRVAINGISKTFEGIGNIGIGVGKAAWKSQEYIGSGAINAVKIGANETSRAGSAMNKFTEGLITKKDTKFVFNKKTGHLDEEGGNYKLSKLGWGLVAGETVYAGLSGASDSFNKANQGNVDYNMTNATPRMDDAGATGDLVFALYNNRRG